MKIAIDARFWGLGNTGLGRYTMNLAGELAKIDRKNEYYLLLRKSALVNLGGLNSIFSKNDKLTPEVNRNRLPPNFHPMAAEVRHYSVREQWVLPLVLNQIQPDLVHVPHFNIPIFWRGKLVVTIHDLIKHQSVGPETSTLPMPVYWFKHRVYREVFRQAVRRASAILVPSEFVKAQLIDKFEDGNWKLETKIHVTPEAPDPVYYQEEERQKSRRAEEQLLKKYDLRQPYLIYVGNAYPHKNLENLIRAMRIVDSKLNTRNSGLSLVIVSARNVFLDRLKQLTTQQGLQNQVKFLGFVPDEGVRELDRRALAFITPSLHEGFGLPGLEAMAAGTLVLSAKASCLPEIYQKHALYFDPYKPKAITDQIMAVLKMNKKERQDRIKKARGNSRKFSWRKLARQTLEVYESVKSG